MEKHSKDNVAVYIDAGEFMKKPGTMMFQAFFSNYSASLREKAQRG